MDSLPRPDFGEITTHRINALESAKPDSDLSLFVDQLPDLLISSHGFFEPDASHLLPE
jgi:hypothetical protein